MRDEEEIRQAFREVQEIGALSTEVIPANLEAVSHTLEWVLEESDGLPDVEER